MKYFFIFCFFLIGCSQQKIEKDETDQNMMLIDSAIIKSKENLLILDSTSKNTDSLISGKVKSTAEKMMFLQKQIETYKVEKNQISTVERVVFRVDTVYIETKKNFWGKEKTTKSIKEDSFSTITLDSSLINLETVDTLKLNQ